jgi:hypothetical protein
MDYKTIIYKSDTLRYPLTDDELDIINEVWIFMENFKRQFAYVTQFRTFIINAISTKYTIDKFYKYEAILNKLFWNLRYIIYPLWVKKDMSQNEYYKLISNDKSEIPCWLLRCKKISYNDEIDLDYILNNHPIFYSTYYRSFINKLVIIDNIHKNIYIKQMEGSSHIFEKNYFNLLTMSILYDRRLYEKIMSNPYDIMNIEFNVHERYYQLDYPFPNLNYCTYYFGNEELRKKRIERMYYTDNKGGTWFKLIKN